MKFLSKIKTALAEGKNGLGISDICDLEFRVDQL